jgi:hypothetical protein
MTNPAPATKATKPTPVERFAEGCLVILILLLPFQTRWVLVEGQLNGGWWEYGTVSLYAVDLLVALVLAGALANTVLEKKSLHLQVSQWLAVLLLTIAAFSLLYANNVVSGLFWLVKLAEGIALFLLLPNLRLRQTAVAFAAIVSGVVQAGLALVQFGLQRVVALPGLGMAPQTPWDLGVQVVATSSGRILRAYGSLPHPNLLAGWLAVVAIIAVVGYTTERRVWPRLATLAVLPLLGAGLWTTFSRQAALGLAISLTIFIALTFIQQRTFPARLVVASAALLTPILLFTLLSPDLVSGRLAATDRLETKSISERGDYLEQTTDLLRTDWVTGVGIGNATAEWQRRDEAAGIEQPSYAYQPVHNHLLLIFTELGLFGLLTMVLLLLGLPQAGLAQKPPAIAWGLALLTLLITGVFDHYLWSLHFGILLFWLMAALFLQVQAEPKQAQGRAPGEQTPPSA